MLRPSMRTRSLTNLLLLTASISLLSTMAVCGPTAAARQPNPSIKPSVAADVGDLKFQLEKGLRARRPKEFQFVDLVVKMVRNDTLPLAMVKSTFLWARKKADSTRYPFPYFERALRVRATKQGIKIP